MRGASVADKVIGKAAALFCKLVRVKSVYALLISEIAIELCRQRASSLSSAGPALISSTAAGMACAP